MRVLHVVPSVSAETGGPAQAVPSLCSALASVGVETTLWSFASQPECACQEYRVGDLEFRLFHTIYRVPAARFCIELHKRLHAFDIVHLHGLWSPAVSMAAYVARCAGVPYVISTHGTLQRISLQRKPYRKRLYRTLIEGRTIRGASRFHFLTSAEAADSAMAIPRKCGYFVIPNGVDPELANATRRGQFRRAFGLQDKRLIVFAGRLHWSKRIELQIDALRLLAVGMRDVMLVLCGPDCGEWGRLSTLAHQHGVADRIVRTGMLPHNRCLEVLADADVFVLSSRHEAHSIAMNEALALGVPTIVTEAVQFPQLETWGAGIEVASTADTLAGAIRYVLTQPGERAKMSLAARHAAKHYLSWGAAAAAMALQYESVALRWPVDPQESILPLAELS